MPLVFRTQHAVRDWTLLAVATLLVPSFASSASAQAALGQPNVELRVAKAPTLAVGDGKSVLAYELHMTNFAAAPMALRRLEVLAAEDGRVLLSLADSTLARVLRRPGVAPAPPLMQRTNIGAGLRAVAFLWVPVDAKAPPARLRHRLTLAQSTGDSARTQQLEGGTTAVTREAVVVGPPLRGGPWLTANGPEDLSGHRWALINVDGTPAIAQRFAIDYVMLGENGQTFEGDRLKNESYYAEGKDALAVADGVVAAIKDGIPENVPGVDSRAVPITLETVGGNYVILDIGEGRYAFYAHLKPGSLKAKVGDRVRRGDVIGLVGNSGNSTEPHLHFHISDSTAPLAAEGIPYAHEAVEVVGRCTGPLVGCKHSTPVKTGRETPMANLMLRFPD